MAKFLKVPVTSLPDSLMSADNVAHVFSASATSTSTRIDYIDGTTTTIAHGAQADYNLRDALSDAIAACHAEGWTKVTFDVSMPSGVAITGITHA